MSKQNQTKSNSRRKAIMGIAGAVGAGAMLPGKWTKPVINSVMLPAHAEASCPEGSSSIGEGACRHDREERTTRAST